MRSIPSLQPTGGGITVLPGDRSCGRRRLLSWMFGEQRTPGIMPPLLRMAIPVLPATPLLGGYDILGGLIALDLEGVRDRMVLRRNALAKSYSTPPDPTTLPEWYSDVKRREKMRYLEGQRRAYLELDEAQLSIEEALRNGRDVEVTAVLREYRMSVAERFGGMLTVEGRFVWVECDRCARRYDCGECRVSEWRRLADPLAGFGGGCLTCPVGHTVFVKKTWIA
jgi:hypothetical protein